MGVLQHFWLVLYDQGEEANGCNPSFFGGVVGVSTTANHESACGAYSQAVGGGVEVPTQRQSFCVGGSFGWISYDWICECLAEVSSDACRYASSSWSEFDSSSKAAGCNVLSSSLKARGQVVGAVLAQLTALVLRARTHWQISDVLDFSSRVLWAGRSCNKSWQHRREASLSILCGSAREHGEADVAISTL